MPAYLFNRNSTPILNYISPLEKLFNTIPNIIVFEYFGVSVSQISDRIDNKNLPLDLMLVYFLDIIKQDIFAIFQVTKRIYISRDVSFF